MKVVRPGQLLFGDFGVVIHGWIFDPRGRRYTSVPEIHRAMGAAILEHVAAQLGIAGGAPEEPDLPVPLDVERATLDAIAAMRWPLNEDPQA